jgi:hypothetical protein
MQVRLVVHQGCVNRVRAMMQQPHIVATWGDSGYVQVTILAFPHPQPLHPYCPSPPLQV